MQEQQSMSLPVVHAHSAGIDVGSRSHFVSVGQEKDDVREFGVYDKDLRTCAQWLKSCGITTVAMESTGSYRQNLYDVPVETGFEVLPVNGAHTKHMKGRKTDVQDCQWYSICTVSDYSQAVFCLTLTRKSCVPSIAIAIFSAGRPPIMLTKKEAYKPYDTTKIESQIRERQIRKINNMFCSTLNM